MRKLHDVAGIVLIAVLLSLCPRAFAQTNTNVNNLGIAGTLTLTGTQILLNTPAAGQNLTVDATPKVVNAYPGVAKDVRSGASFAINGDGGSPSDRTSLVLATNSTTSTAVSIAAAGSSGFPAGFTFALCNAGTVVLTFTPTTSTINGNPTLVLLGQPSGGNPECAFFWNDGTNYFAGEMLPTDALGRLAASAVPPASVCAPGSFATQTDAATVTWAVGSQLCANAALLFTVHSGSRTLNLTGLVTGGSYKLKLTQDATGGEGLLLGTGCTWKVSGNGMGAITLTSAAGAIDVLKFDYDGTNCLATLVPEYN